MSDNTKILSESFPFFLKVIVLESVDKSREASPEESPVHLNTESCLCEQQVAGSALHCGANSD